MTDNSYIIPRRLRKYLRRLVSEYTSTNRQQIGEVILGSECRVEEETDYNWDAQEQGHDVIFLVPDHLMVNIPLDSQKDIEERVKQDLNKASSSARGEYVANVYFDYFDEDGSTERLSVGPSGTQPDFERLWSATRIRLFISHRDSVKAKVHDLAACLEEHGITSFVAHETIEPDEDWQREIRRALQSMDAMLVFITDDLFDSIWTNQEIGYALACSVPIISIKVGKQDPAGFIRHRQAIHGLIDNATLNASRVRETLRKRLIDSPRFREVTLERFKKAISFKMAESAFEDLKLIDNFTVEEISSLIQAYNGNNQLHLCYRLSRGNKFLEFVNSYSDNKYVGGGNKIRERKQSADDDIPF